MADTHGPAAGVPAPQVSGSEAPRSAPHRLLAGNWPLVLGLFFIMIAALLLTTGVFTGRGGPQAPEGLAFTIPAGARNDIARPGFDSAIAIPTDIRFASPAEAIITVRNLDDVTHRAGPFLVGPGQTFVQRFPEPGRYPIVCTVDPLETVIVTVEG